MSEFETNRARQQLGVWDSVSIIVGIVIGVGIHETAPTVMANAGSATMTMVFWVAGGVLSLLGALCYAELASAYPRSGGEYCYLTRAFGRPTGFLFGWSQLTVVRTGNVGMMYSFSRSTRPSFGVLVRQPRSCSPSRRR